MLSRISFSPRFSVLIRQLNYSKKNFKKITVSTNEESLKSMKIESNDQEINKYRNSENNKKNQNLVKGIKKAISFNKNFNSTDNETNIKVYKLLLSSMLLYIYKTKLT